MISLEKVATNENDPIRCHYYTRVRTGQLQLMSDDDGLTSRLLELEYLEEVVCAGVDDYEVLMAVNGHTAWYVDLVCDTAVERTVDGSRGVDVTGSIQ